MAASMATPGFFLVALLVLPAVLVGADESVVVKDESKVEVDIGKGKEASGPKCPIPETSDTLEIGGSKQASGKCVLYKCQMKGSNAVTVSHSCVVVKPGEGCTVKEQDVSLPFPKCCPVTRCTKGGK
ncbi:venom peptide HsVx1-like [Schistocerca americana]|uniref:venom peptide HsVx1-like n=1 Tax=Schistocerca americana TaxID=7009 RepID=UPI001F4F4744|nr:venom peptide HsVx1-like [Schistocerca americana]